MSVAQSMMESPSVEGLAVVNEHGFVELAEGIAADSRVKTLLGDADWLATASQRRLMPILFAERKLAAFVARCGGGHMILISGKLSETSMRFILDVDFSADILQLLLTDPYDAMVVVDPNERVMFISPVHERVFGLQPDDGLGRRLRDISPSSRLHHILRTGVAEIGQIFPVGGGERVASRHPIRHDGEVVGAIGRIMFKSPEQVETLARRLASLERTFADFEKAAEEDVHGERYLDAIIGQSAVIEAVRAQIRKVAPLDVPVLIQGDSGTGKELVARALHMLSPRHEQRLVTVNAAALASTLVESELFGYESGSFTGADRKGRAGKFELADNGTIFLDEIGDMPLDMQAKLLRVLQERTVERLGGDRPKRVDFRLCSATNHNLEALVDQKTFRLDLFYRLSPVRITLPRLEDRREDIPLLMDHFVAQMAQKYGRPVPEIDADVAPFLMQCPWPGNIRQLRHDIERAFVFLETRRLTVADFRRDAPHSLAPPPSLARAADIPEDGTLKTAVERLEQDMIAAAMQRRGGNKKRVATELGISRSYLYTKLGEVPETAAEPVDAPHEAEPAL
jgi:transcriptional regulator with PAS, ATPase and Fis domain